MLCKPIKKEPAKVYTEEEYAKQYLFYVQKPKLKDNTHDTEKKKEDHL